MPPKMDAPSLFLIVFDIGGGRAKQACDGSTGGTAFSGRPGEHAIQVKPRQEQDPGLAPWNYRKSGAMTRLTIAITLIRMFIDGPEVSFSGSPTVSPTTNAL